MQAEDTPTARFSAIGAEVDMIRARFDDYHTYLIVDGKIAEEYGYWDNGYWNNTVYIQAVNKVQALNAS